MAARNGDDIIAKLAAWYSSGRDRRPEFLALDCQGAPTLRCHPVERHNMRIRNKSQTKYPICVENVVLLDGRGRSLIEGGRWCAGRG